MKKTPQSKIDNNCKWAKNNVNKVRQYKRKYKHEQKRLAREHIKFIKELSGCKTCGNKNIHCLDFHHRPKTKKKNTVCNLVRHGYSLELIAIEHIITLASI
jgi:molecular chaperone GrpE (heat shock protein)